MYLCTPPIHLDYRLNDASSFNLFAQLVFCTAAFSDPVSLWHPVNVETQIILNTIPVHIICLKRQTHYSSCPSPSHLPILHSLILYRKAIIKNGWVLFHVSNAFVAFAQTMLDMVFCKMLCWWMRLRNLIQFLILSPPKDACNESNPRIIDDSRARKLANDLKRWPVIELISHSSIWDVIIYKWMVCWRIVKSLK